MTLYSSMALCTSLLFWPVIAQTENKDNETSTSQSQDDQITTAVPSLFGAAFLSFQPCECDIDPKVCDIPCCCDTVCSDEQRTIFQCESRKEVQQLFYRDCRVKPVDFDYLWPFLCVQRANTPFLGDFYLQSQTDLVLNLNDFDAHLSAAVKASDETGLGGIVHNMEPDSNVLSSSNYFRSGANYTHGSPLLTARLIDPNAGATSGAGDDTDNIEIGFVTLPTPVLSGRECVWNPLTFLEEVEYFCNSEVNRKNCPLVPAYHSSAYVTPPVSVQDVRSEVPSILQTNTELKPAEVLVSYWCEVDTEIDPESSEIFIGASQRQWQKCGLPKAHNVPDPPEFDNITQQCLNMVREVEYQIFWNGSQVRSVLANVRLSHSPDLIGDEMQPFVQHFAVRYIHDSGLGETAVDPVSNPFGLTRRSGNPGYDAGAPLISVTATIRGGDTEVEYNKDRQLMQMEPGSFPKGKPGACSFAQRTPVLFQQSVETGCVMYQDFSKTSCSKLRLEIMRAFDSLSNFTHLSRFGNPTSKSNSNFIELLMPNRSITAECTSVPYRMDVELVISETARTDTRAVLELIGGRVRYSWIQFEELLASRTKFYLQQGITFIEQPVPKPTNVKKYYLRDDLRYRCPSEVTCWDELFYPFLALSHGFDRTYAISVGLSTLLAALVAGIVTAPCRA